MKRNFDRMRAAPDRLSRRGPGFALRQRHHGLAEGAWRETVTHFKPEPWLVALEHDRLGPPVRPGHRPTANR